MSVKRPKVALGMSAFWTGNEVFRALDGVYKNVDVMIIIDGKYFGFEWPYDFSQDEWLEEVGKRYPNAITMRYSAEQMDKRQKYLDVAAEEGCDYVMVWDSDDYVHPEFQDWDLFYKMLEMRAKNSPEEQLFWMWCWVKPEWAKNFNIVKDNTWMRYVRVIKDPGSVKYFITHYTMIRKDDPEQKMLEAKCDIDGVRFTLDSVQRSPEFIASGRKWAKWNIDQERVRWSEWHLKKAMASQIVT